MFAWWHAHRHVARGACGESAYGGGEGGEGGPASFGPGGGGGGWRGHPGHGHDHGGPDHPFHQGAGGDEFGGGFGVRRPLRFLAFKLDLSEKQVGELATVLSELKTERAQAAVDQRRTTSTLADSVAADAFDEAKAKGAADERTKSNERVQQAVVRALGRIHALLEPEQRTRLAYLLRTGALSI
jgi:Spy/CpxP family protein refolding chaperone